MRKACERSASTVGLFTNRSRDGSNPSLCAICKTVGYVLRSVVGCSPDRVVHRTRQETPRRCGERIVIRSHRHGFVSVVIPAFNMQDLVGRAVESALAQTYGQTEILVIDDGSTDETRAVVQAFGEPVRLISKSNGGLSSARNRGIAEASGEFIAYLDADDYWEAEKLARQIDHMRARRDVGFCSTATRVVDAKGTVLNIWQCPCADGQILKIIFEANATVPGSGSSVVVRADVQRHVGPFDEQLRSLEDIDMWMRLAAEASYTCIPEPLTVIRKRPGSMSRHLDVMRESAIRVMRKNRHLLNPEDRGRFWESAYAAMLTDYAKWEFRAGRKLAALAHVTEAAMRAPIARGRLCAGLFIAMVRGTEI